MLKLIVVTLACLLLGAVLGQAVLEQPIVGVVLGLFVGLPLGRSWQVRQPHTSGIGLLGLLIGAVLVVVWKAATLELALVAALLTLLGMIVSFFVCAATQRELYNGSASEAFLALLNITIGRTLGHHIIDDGKTTVPANPTGPVMGPRRVIIRPDNAVVTVLNSRLGRISGPATFTSLTSEYVKSIYRLSEHSKSIQIEHVMTRDSLATTIRLDMLYGIDIALDIRTGERAELTVDEQAAIRAIHTSTTDWREIALEAVETCVRQAAAGMNLRDIVHPAGCRRLEEQARRLANLMLLPWHIVVHQVIIKEARA